MSAHAASLSAASQARNDKRVPCPPRTQNHRQRPPRRVFEMMFLDAKGKMRMPPAKGMKIEPAEECIAAWYGRFRVILHGQEAGSAVSAPTPSSPSPVQFGRRLGLLASD